MNVSLIFQAIEAGKLFHIMSNKTENNKIFIKFKRHDSIFTFICSISKTVEGEFDYKLIKDGQKARVDTIKAMWDDYEEFVLFPAMSASQKKEII